MHTLLIANTKSGAAAAASEVSEQLRALGVAVEDLALTELCSDPNSIDEDKLRDAVALIRDHGVDRIVVAGGDGSLGAAALLSLRADVPLAVVPTGTANSFARWLGLPLDVEEASRLAGSGDVITMTAEVASADGRPFVNVASTGLAVIAAHGALPLKKRLGPLAYAAGAAKAGATGKPITTAVRNAETEVWRGDAWQIAIAASGAFGGDSNTGGVNPRDGKLDVAIVEAGARRKLVRHAWAMNRGRLVREDDVRHIRSRSVELDLPPHTQFNVDGEILRLARPRFHVVGTISVIAGAAS